MMNSSAVGLTNGGDLTRNASGVDDEEATGNWSTNVLFNEPD
jgi:hypothetical protein